MGQTFIAHSKMGSREVVSMLNDSTHQQLFGLGAWEDLHACCLFYACFMNSACCKLNASWYTSLQLQHQHC